MSKTQFVYRCLRYIYSDVARTYRLALRWWSPNSNVVPFRPSSSQKRTLGCFASPFVWLARTRAYQTAGGDPRRPGRRVCIRDSGLRVDPNSYGLHCLGLGLETPAGPNHL